MSVTFSKSVLFLNFKPDSVVRNCGGSPPGVENVAMFSKPADCVSACQIIRPEITFSPAPKVYVHVKSTGPPMVPVRDAVVWTVPQSPPTSKRKK